MGKVILVLSGKGGVGKSVVSAALAAQLAQEGKRVGLMDADIYGPSAALLFNVRARPDEQAGGLTPPMARGVELMSVDLFASGRPIPLTGRGAGQAILELLALTDWGRLDFLIVDMPPATGDIMLTLTSLRKKGLAAVVVTMPDKLSTAVAHRTLELLRSGKVPIIGVLENMHRAQTQNGRISERGPSKLAREFKVPLLGILPYDSRVPEAVERSNIQELTGTKFAAELRRSMSSLFG